jgi:hypothetical protein
VAKFTHKIGNSRAGDGTRIWLEGQRLLEAGFKHRLYFARHIKNAGTKLPKSLILELVAKSEWEDMKRADKGTVAGSPERPIIDITGAIVAEIFEGYTHVSVNYLKGRIVIDGTEAPE